jgi:hypothetical protein
MGRAGDGRHRSTFAQHCQPGERPRRPLTRPDRSSKRENQIADLTQITRNQDAQSPNLRGWLKQIGGSEYHGPVHLPSGLKVGWAATVVMAAAVGMFAIMGQS